MTDEDTLRNIVREIVKQTLSELNVEPPYSETSPPAYYAPWTGVEYEAHPSRLQFDIKEASIPSNDLLEFLESKICSLEKNTPCDQCGMCRNLGF